MKREGIILFWDRPVPGKEGAALELMGMATKYFETQRKEGHIASLETVLLGAYGGKVNGFILVRGESDKLHALKRSDDYLRLITKSEIVLEGFGTAVAFVDDGVEKLLNIYSKNI